MPLQNLTVKVENTNQAKVDDVIERASNQLGWIQDPENTNELDASGQTRVAAIENYLMSRVDSLYTKNKILTDGPDKTDFEASVSIGSK